MSEPIRHGDEWWAQAADGTWLRWNAAEYRWDSQPGMPPFPFDPATFTQSPALRPGPGPTGEASTPAPATDGTSAVSSPGLAAPAPTAVAAERLRDFEPTDRLGRLASVLIGLATAIAAVTLPLLIARATSPTAIFKENTFLAGLSTLSGLALVASVIATLVWFKDAYSNAVALGATFLRYTPGWAIGAWFIPVGNLFIPKQIADDLWRTSDATLPPDAGAQWKFRPVPAILHFWWFAWVAYLVGSLVANGVAQEALDENDASRFRAGLWLEAVTNVLLVVAGVLLIKIISNVVARQRERAEMLRSPTDEVVASTGGPPTSGGSLPS